MTFYNRACPTSNFISPLIVYAPVWSLYGFRGLGGFPTFCLNKDTPWNTWNCYSGRYIDDTGTLINTMEYPFRERLMTFQSSTSNSDFPSDQTLHQFDNLDRELDFYRITTGFHEASATGMVCQQEILTLTDTWFCPYWDLHMLLMLRPFS